MYITDGTNICIPRGDSASVKAFFLAEDGETPYIFDDEQYAVFSVLPFEGAPAIIKKTIRKSAQSDTGMAFLDFSPEETDIPCQEYPYTIRLYSGDGAVIDTVAGFPGTAVFAVGKGIPPDKCTVSAEGIRVLIAKSGSDVYPPYTGEHTVIPLADNDVILETANKVTRDNITVKKIPSLSVANESGGRTFIIGG